ncbi:MAG TPA: M2 family metallopeptidase [Thermoguttaceae bacterium]|nr:M2 family metallopeptidase [Thermoguttaceae bacterium]
MKITLLLMLSAGFVAVTAAVSLASEEAPEPDAHNVQARAKAFLDLYEADFARIDKEFQLASWAASCSGKEEDYRRAAECELTLRKYHGDKEAYRVLGDLLRREKSLDPLTRRALAVAKLTFEENQLPSELLAPMVQKASDIEKSLNTYRAKIDGKAYSNNELLEMLAQEKDAARRRTYWEALKQVGDVVAPKLIELAKLRNEAARKLGYANYWEMRIHLQEHDPEQLSALFAELKNLTDSPFNQMKGQLDAELARRFGATPAELMPWHYDNPFFQAAPPSEAVNLDEFYREKKKEEIVEIGRRFYARIGMPIDAILERSDLFDRPGKDQHAFSKNLDRHGDARILCNLTPAADEMDTLLHEAGHAAYDYYMDFSLPYNLRDAAHAFTTEGFAMFMGALAKTPEWIAAHAGADAKRVDQAADAIREQRRREQLIFARWALVMFHFEKGFYENPDRDLNALWWECVDRYQGLKRPPARNQADWASKPHFTMAPVYYHNYMLGELFAAQLRHAVEQNVPGEGPFFKRPGIGPFLKEQVFMPGSRWPWPEFVEKATGEKLTAKYFADEVKK